ncbi:hypothetical protein RIF29_40570 [Crotalaria pallida]|uniref:Peptidase A1 domain-containing protein n=1 Tax=Crotalaria pallida TaxID=3830 RepID=A0AAN9E452_CROPI
MMNHYESHIASLHRSILHAKYVSMPARARATSQTNPPDTPTNLIPNNDTTEYIAAYYIGTPPTRVYAFVDTASEIIWTKGLPLLNPSNSTTYQTLPCGSKSCLQLGGAKTCRGENQPCTYQMTRADNSISLGVFSSDEFAFDGSSNRNVINVGKLVFGYINISTSSNLAIRKENGTLALNRGQLSFISQLGINKFSHCWDMQTNGSKNNNGFKNVMYFGENKAKIYPEDLTPLLLGKLPNYYVQVDGITINEIEVPIPRGSFNIVGSRGGFIVDCGTTFTMLKKEAYEPFLSMIRENLGKPIIPGPIPELELCYNGTIKDLDSVPEVTFRFSRGVKVKLMKEVTFMQFQKGLWCLAILRSPNTISMLGSFQMRNYWVGYDLQANGVSFTYQQREKGFKCSKDLQIGIRFEAQWCYPLFLLGERLMKRDLLTQASDAERVNFSLVADLKDPLITKAAKRLISSEGELKTQLENFHRDPTISSNYTHLVATLT